MGAAYSLDTVQPQVSILLPTFNRASTLRRALDSVRAQSFTDWELIVADDGSTDDTFSTFQAWAAERPDRAIFLSSPINSGVSSARNRAARAARAPWLAFLDSDDEWLPQKLARQVNSKSMLVHAEELWIRNGLPVPVAKRYAKSGGRVFQRCVDLCFISPSATLIRRDLFNELGGFREDFPVCEDYDLWLKVSARFDVEFIAEPLVKKYGGHADQLSTRNPAMDYYRAKALLPYLDENSLSHEERAYVTAALARKCEILLKGYSKHGNQGAHVGEVAAWAARSVRTANHSDHSAALR